MRGSNSTWRRASRRVCCSMPLSSCCAHVRHTHATPCVNCLLRAAWLGTLGVRHASYASRYQGRSCGKEAGGWGWGERRGGRAETVSKRAAESRFSCRASISFLTSAASSNFSSCRTIAQATPGSTPSPATTTHGTMQARHATRATREWPKTVQRGVRIGSVGDVVCEGNILLYHLRGNAPGAAAAGGQSGWRGWGLRAPR